MAKQNKPKKKGKEAPVTLESAPVVAKGRKKKDKKAARGTEPAAAPKPAPKAAGAPTKSAEKKRTEKRPAAKKKVARGKDDETKKKVARGKDDDAKKKAARGKGKDDESAKKKPAGKKAASKPATTAQDDESGNEKKRGEDAAVDAEARATKTATAKKGRKKAQGKSNVPVSLDDVRRRVKARLGPSSVVDEEVEGEPEGSADLEAAPTAEQATALEVEVRDDDAAPVDAELSDEEENRRYLRGLLEALLFASDRPLSVRELARAAKLDRPGTQALLEELIEDSRARGIVLYEVAGGWTMRSNPVYADYVQKLLALRPVRLSRAQLETLAIIAYRQPVTRPEVDDIRGVDSGPVLKGLLERDLIKIVGKKDEVGRPMLYGTAPTFLELFSLESLNDLPSLKEFTELSDESRDLFVQKTGEQAPEGALDRELPDDVERDLAPHDEAPAEPQAGEASETEAQQETEPEPAEPQETEPEADEQPSIAADAVDDAVDDAPGDNLEADEDDDEADETEADEADETDDGSMDDEDADDAPDSDDEVPSEDEPPALDASDSEDDALDEPPDSSALASQPGFDPESAREVSEPPEPDPNDEA